MFLTSVGERGFILTTTISQNLPEIVCFCAFLAKSTTTGIFGLILKIPIVKGLGNALECPERLQ